MQKELMIALVLGPKGVTGSALIAGLLDAPQWDRVITLSRTPFRPLVPSDKLISLQGDLFDLDQLKQTLAPYAITHIFFAAHALVKIGYSKNYATTLASFQSAKLISPLLKVLRNNSGRVARYLGRRFAIESEKYDPEKSNLRMLCNTIDAVQAGVGNLQHVALVTGTAYHGIALGPYFHPHWKSHFEAADPPVPDYPCFYYELEATLKNLARQQGFSYSIVRPGFVLGYGENPAMNFGVTLAVYANILKEMGLPLYYPGIKANYEARWQMSSADDIAKVMMESAINPCFQDQTFLVANQDVCSWATMWPEIAAYFDMPYAANFSSPLLSQISATKRGDRAWKNIAIKQQLQVKDRAAIANLSMMFKSTVLDWDYTYSLEPLSNLGMQTESDTKNTFYNLFRKLEEMKLIPRAN